MKGQNLSKRFIELAEEALAFFPGNIHDKMTAWCLSELTNAMPDFPQAKLQFIAQERASTLFAKIIKWLNDNENDDYLILVSSYLEIYVKDSVMRVGDNQLGYIEANVLTGLALTDLQKYHVPVLPTYISLYKYVTWDTLVAILGNAKMKASEPRKCNDVYEFMPAWGTEEEKQRIFEIMDGLESLMFCLSRTPSSSVMWGQYAEDGAGALLRFSVPVYKLIAGSNEHECMLIVAPDEEALSNSLDKDRPLIISQVVYKEERPAFAPKKTYYDYDQLYCRKGTDWAYEQEMRIIFNKDELGTTFEEGHYLTPVLMPYLTDIVLGQRCEKTVEQVRALIGENHDWLHNIPIHRTEYSPSSYKLQLPVPESLGIESVPLYRRMGLGIPPMNN